MYGDGSPRRAPPPVARIHGRTLLLVAIGHVVVILVLLDPLLDRTQLCGLLLDVGRRGVAVRAGVGGRRIDDAAAASAAAAVLG